MCRVDSRQQPPAELEHGESAAIAAEALAKLLMLHALLAGQGQACLLEAADATQVLLQLPGSPTSHIALASCLQACWSCDGPEVA